MKHIEHYYTDMNEALSSLMFLNRNEDGVVYKIKRGYVIYPEGILRKNK